MDPSRNLQPSRFPRIGPHIGMEGDRLATSDLANHADVGEKIDTIEQSILSHPRLIENLEIVRVYLTIGKYQLEPISWLRQEGLWRSVDPMTMHEMSLRLPQNDHLEALKEVQPSLFYNPPSDLFDLICQYRWITGFRQTGILPKLENPVPTLEQRGASKYEAGRTAPDGHKYICPSRGCKKPYAKSGHLKNHINQNHPDFLRLHPDWKPHYRPVETASSDSSSPPSERHATGQSMDRHSQRIQRPVSAGLGTASGELHADEDDVPGSPMRVDFPDSFEMSQAGSDQQIFSNVRQYQQRRISDHGSRHSSVSGDSRQRNQGYRSVGALLQGANLEVGDQGAAKRLSGRPSSRDPRFPNTNDP